MNPLPKDVTASPLGRLVSKSLGAQELELKRDAVFQRFGAVLPLQDAGDFALGLHPFTAVRPLCYFSEATFELALRLFEANPMATFEALAKFGGVWGHAIESLFRPGASWNKEGALRLGEPTDLLAFEHIWHPEYQRFSEHIFNHLIKIPLELLGKSKGKDFVSLKLALRADKLVELGHAELVSGFSSVIRNAISHGSTFYGDREIHYRDSKAEELLLASQFGESFDSFVDCCSGTAAAAMAFIARNQAAAAQFGLHLLPLGIRYAILRGQASHQLFSVEGMIEVSGVSPHLNIYCSCASRSQSLHRYEAIHVAVRALQLGCTNYDRICVSIDCGSPVHSLIVLSGPKLIQALQPGVSSEALNNIILTDLLWHDENAFVRRWSLLRASFASAWQKTQRDVITQWKKSGLGVWKHRYAIRNIENRTAGKARGLLAEVVLNPRESISRRNALCVMEHAIKVLKKTRLKASSVAGESGIRARPSYVWLRLHSRDARKRSLQSRQRRSPELLAEAEWMTFIYRSKPIMQKQPDEVFRGIRISYHGLKP